MARGVILQVVQEKGPARVAGVATLLARVGEPEAAALRRVGEGNTVAAR